MSNYRIVRLAALHGFDVTPSLIRRQPGILTQPYEKLLSTLNDEKVLYSNSFSVGMQALGHDAYEIVWDFELLQKKWAQENGFNCDEREWQFGTICEQIRRLRPDVIYLQGTESAIPGRFTQNQSSANIATLLKKEFEFIRAIAMFSGFPTNIDRTVDVDILFSCSPAIQEHYGRLGRQSVLCYHAFDPSILDLLKPQGDELYDFTFAGSCRIPESRYWFLRDLLEESLIEVWLNEPVGSHKGYKKKLHLYALPKLLKSKGRKIAKFGIECLGVRLAERIAKSNWSPSSLTRVCENVVKEQNIQRQESRKPNWIRRKLPERTLRETFPERCRESVSGLEYFNIIHSSKVSFNRHTDSTGHSVGNMRMFEVTGVGSCLLTDSGKNISDLFEPDVEILTYETIEEAKEKYRYVSQNKAERTEIARRGQLRALKDHTVDNRCQLIDSVIQESLN